MDVADFDYPLPSELIAQAPLPERDASRLLVLPRVSGPIEHRMVRDLPQLLQPDDVLVANDADPLLPTATLIPAALDVTRSPLRPVAVTVNVAFRRRRRRRGRGGRSHGEDR